MGEGLWGEGCEESAGFLSGDGDTRALCWLLDPRKIGGFCIYIPVWVAQGARDCRLTVTEGKTGKQGAAILFVPRA